MVASAPADTDSQIAEFEVRFGLINHFNAPGTAQAVRVTWNLWFRDSHAQGVSFATTPVDSSGVQHYCLDREDSVQEVEGKAKDERASAHKRKESDVGLLVRH